MSWRWPHVVAPLIAAAGMLLVPGCGTGDEGARTTLSPVQPTSYVTVDPPTTTTTTTPPPPPTMQGGAEVAQQEQIYTVQNSDCCLSSIAEKFGITLQALLDHNGIGTDHLLIPGQTQLRIPPGAAAVGGTGVGAPAGGTGQATATPTPVAGNGGAGDGCVHVVVAGDYQGKVANQYGVSLDELAAANANNPAWNVFRLGDELVIPPGGTC